MILMRSSDKSSNRQRQDFASLEQRKNFSELNQNVQKLITNLSRGFQTFEELRESIHTDSEQTKEHITHELQHLKKQQDALEYRKRLLDSLWFAEIHSREERIADPHRETFKWIFDKSGHAIRPWDSFVQWLENGKGTYWINGKAGSGKSTLMSFLSNHDRTKRSLEVWSGNKIILIPKFFFWSGGSPMEKSIEGLLRSLTWQIIQALPDQISRNSQMTLPLGIDNSAAYSRDAIAAWTPRRLQNMLRSLLLHSVESHRLCFFIDGLDEYHGDQDDLVSFIQDIVKGTEIKVCLSSRPSRAFDQAYKLSASLRLQDLTSNDIRKFVVDSFKSISQTQELAAQHLKWLDFAPEMILWRAEGVFLWVTLAVKDQIRGLRNDDSVKQLKERLDSLPGEVEGIYARMLNQIEEPYRIEASQILQLASSDWDHCRTLLDFTLAFLDRLDGILRFSSRMDEVEILVTSRLRQKRIITTCVGLLEIHDYRSQDSDSGLYSDSDSDSDSDSSSQHPNSHFRGEIKNWDVCRLESKVTVDFIHRTAFDFVRHSKQGVAFLKANSPPDFNALATYFKVQLAKLRLLGLIVNKSYVYVLMENLRAIEDQNGVVQLELCELLDAVMYHIDQTHRNRPLDSHWSARWGQLKSKSIRPREKWSPKNLPIWWVKLLMNSNPINRLPQPNDRRMVVATRPSLLAFAASHGCYKYVRHVFDRQKIPFELGVLDYLLYCLIYYISLSNYINVEYSTTLYGLSFEGLGLVIEFLSRGANPNARTGEETIWSMLLIGMYGLNYEGSRQFSSRTFLPQLIKAFIAHGADMHVICTTYSGFYQLGDSNRKEQVCDFELQLSAPAVIELWLSDQPEISEIRGKFAATGVPYYSKCTKIKIYDVDDLDRVDITAFKEFDLNEHESNTFLKLWEPLQSSEPEYEQSSREIKNLGDKIHQDRLKFLSTADHNTSGCDDDRDKNFQHAEKKEGQRTIEDLYDQNDTSDEDYEDANETQVS